MKNHEVVHISLSSEMIREIEEKTGYALGDLDGVIIGLKGTGALLIKPVTASHRVLRATAECNGNDNMWQGQSSCGDFIKKC
ncbi:hypothetical protein ANAEL_05416 [Anaerolineales bacterium]|nr:hypothetical protein ANAEL_05416 [Anaerolineales bacterium]